MPTNKTIILGGVEEYIVTFSKDIQLKLEEIRAVIKSCAVRSIETTSYFGIPGYSYQGYKYNGMFAWFSVSEQFLRLHVIPPVIENHARELNEYKLTKSIVSFPLDKKLPVELVKKLVKASIDVMKKGE